MDKKPLCLMTAPHIVKVIVYVFFHIMIATLINMLYVQYVLQLQFPHPELAQTVARVALPLILFIFPAAYATYMRLCSYL